MEKKIFIPTIVPDLVCPDCQSTVKTTDGTWFECTNCRRIESSATPFEKNTPVIEKPLKVAFSAIRSQPFTNGIFTILSQMLRDNDVVIIGLGSVQIEGTAANPFSAKQRTDMIRKVFGKNSKDKIKIVPLHDIGAKEKVEWVDYCMSQIKGKQLPTPTRYYAGSVTDLDWFLGSENDNGDPIELINLNRHESNMLAGTFVRQSISTGTDEWKSNVPECLIDMIQDNYPESLLLEFHRQKKRS